MVFERSRPATNDNIQAAIEFVNDMSAGGGTELGSAVEAPAGWTYTGVRVSTILRGLKMFLASQLCLTRSTSA